MFFFAKTEERMQRARAVSYDGAGRSTTGNDEQNQIQNAVAHAHQIVQTGIVYLRFIYLFINRQARFKGELSRHNVQRRRNTEAAKISSSFLCLFMLVYTILLLSSRA